MIASVDTKGDWYVDFKAFQNLFAASGTPLPQGAKAMNTATLLYESPKKSLVGSRSFSTSGTESLSGRSMADSPPTWCSPKYRSTLETDPAADR
ncbi:hypothetical protein PsorP6_009360 [Peronosclerospora sorghi]|uniref:Uncharacterized protein n=1 Tax=Peronosclerospora sorghi TaxID=230839 RepID=A0ACC0VYU6_9STRA|nr:hypothetical protein PsorP6_009360 [Peronosclerospora sorghi]